MGLVAFAGGCDGGTGQGVAITENPGGCHGLSSEPARMAVHGRRWRSVAEQGGQTRRTGVAAITGARWSGSKKQGRKRKKRRASCDVAVFSCTAVVLLRNLDPSSSCRSTGRMVPTEGLEPPHLAAHGPEPCASTNSATWALPVKPSVKRCCPALLIFRSALLRKNTIIADVFPMSTTS